MRTILTACLLLGFFHSSAQVNYQPGSIEKINGEKIEGWIDYRAWAKNPGTIRFKATQEGSLETYTVNELASFAITGKEIYKRAVVTKDMRPVEPEELIRNPGDSVAVDTAFLRVIAEGHRLSLYVLVNDKTHFFIKDSTGEYKELMYRVNVFGSRNAYTVQTVPAYRDQLRVLLLGDPELPKLQKKLAKIQYKEDDLGALVNEINGNTTSTVFVKKRTRPVFFVSGGISHVMMKTEGFDKLDAIDFPGSTAPTFGLGLDILSDRQFNAFAIRIEALFSSWSVKGNTTTTHWTGDDMERNYSLKMTNITPAISFLFSPFRGPSYRIYGGVGVGYNISTYGGNVLVENNITDNTSETWDDYVDYTKSWGSVNVHLGGIFNNWECILSNKILGGVEKINNASVKLNFYSLRVAYRF